VTRILIVDDEESVAELLASFCASEGREVTVCTSSLEALGRIAEAPPDVLISDIVMARLDGLSLVREARAIDAQMEAIVITGYASSYPMADVLQCGASDLIVKPVRMQEFRTRVDLAIERRRAAVARTARERQLQVTSTEMIDGLQRELEEALKPPTPARRTPAS
jgi:DNA-binding response OmpR family regulator